MFPRKAVRVTPLDLPRRLAAAAAALALVASPVRAGVYDATIFGAAGTFGTLGSTTPSGKPLTKVAVPGWRFQPGQSAYFSAVASDGSVLVGNIAQSFNQLIPTAESMVVTVFQPASSALQSVVIDTPAPGQFQGEDIGDLLVAPNAAGAERVFFTSSTGSLLGTRPAFGALRKSGSSWVVDFVRTANDLAASSAAGASGCPVFGNHRDCRGMVQMVRLPKSGKIVVAQYFSPTAASRSGGIMVVSPSGTVEAHYWVPAYTSCLPNAPGCASPQLITLSPAVFSADPTSPRGDERFVMSYENRYPNDAQCQAVQEFSYDDNAKTIRPISAPIFPQRLRLGACDPQVSDAQHWHVIGGAAYDHEGHLWVQHSQGFGNPGVGPIVVYKKAGGKRKLETACAWSAGVPYGVPCSADVEVGNVRFGTGILEDPTSKTMYLVGFSNGQMWPVTRSSNCGGEVFTLQPGLLHDLGHLTGEPPPPNEARYAMRPVIDAARKRLYFPVETVEDCNRDANNDCAGFQAGVTRNQWLYAVQIDP